MNRIFSNLVECPPIIKTTEFLYVLSECKYNIKKVNQAIYLSESVHENQPMRYNGGSIPNQSYLNGHIFPVTLGYLNHSIKNGYKPYDNEILALILHDSLEDIDTYSPYFSLHRDNINISIKEYLESEILTLFSKDVYNIVCDLTKNEISRAGDLLTLEKLNNLKSVNRINMKYCDRLIGTRAKLYKGYSKISLEDVILRRCNDFHYFATNETDKVWPSIIEEFKINISKIKKILS